MTNANENLESWNDYISGNFLKAINVENENDAYIVINVSVILDEKTNTKRLRLLLENNKKEWDFDLNKTNGNYLKSCGVLKPKDIVGKKIYFKKALVRNPKTNIEVDSLRIKKVE